MRVEVLETGLTLGPCWQCLWASVQREKCPHDPTSPTTIPRIGPTATEQTDTDEPDGFTFSKSSVFLYFAVDGREETRRNRRFTPSRTLRQGENGVNAKQRCPVLLNINTFQTKQGASPCSVPQKKNVWSVHCPPIHDPSIVGVSLANVWSSLVYQLLF